MLGVLQMPIYVVWCSVGAWEAGEQRADGLLVFGNVDAQRFESFPNRDLDGALQIISMCVAKFWLPKRSDGQSHASAERQPTERRSRGRQQRGRSQDEHRRRTRSGSDGAPQNRARAAAALPS